MKNSLDVGPSPGREDFQQNVDRRALRLLLHLHAARLLLDILHLHLHLHLNLSGLVQVMVMLRLIQCRRAVQRARCRPVQRRVRREVRCRRRGRCYLLEFQVNLHFTLKIKKIITKKKKSIISPII